MARFLVVGLNPAWQKVHQLNSFKEGAVNRVQKTVELASGKGINCARVLKKLGHDVSVLQIVGGNTGQRILSDLETLDIISYHVETNTPTRICTTLVSPGQDASEIIEPFEVDVDVTGELVKQVKSLPGKFEGVLFCGSLPWGLPSTTYSDILEPLACGKVWLDGFQGFDRNFFNQVTGIKINREEFISLKDELQDELPINLEYILVTQGSDEAVLYQAQARNRLIALHRFSLPQIEVVNSIGSGDAVMAGFVSGLSDFGQIQEACKHSLALGSASCLTLLPAEYHYADYTRFREAIKNT